MFGIVGNVEGGLLKTQGIVKHRIVVMQTTDAGQGPDT